MDIAIGLRQGGWGRHWQRGHYLCSDRGPRFMGVEVNKGSAAAISKVATSTEHCFWQIGLDQKHFFLIF